MALAEMMQPTMTLHQQGMRLTMAELLPRTEREGVQPHEARTAVHRLLLHTVPLFLCCANLAT